MQRFMSYRWSAGESVKYLEIPGSFELGLFGSRTAYLPLNNSLFSVDLGQSVLDRQA